MKLVSGIVDSGFFAQSALSAGIATKDSNGNEITSTYLTAVPEGYATESFVTSKGYLTAVPAGTMNTASLNKSGDLITGYNGTAFAGAGGGVSVTSPRGTININGDEIEGTNSAALFTTTGGFVTGVITTANNMSFTDMWMRLSYDSLGSNSGGTMVMPFQNPVWNIDGIMVSGRTETYNTASASAATPNGAMSVSIPLGEITQEMFVRTMGGWVNLSGNYLTVSAEPKKTVTGVGELAWNSALNSVRNLSATWNSTYNTVSTNSASWGGGASYTGDAQGALDEVYSKSGTWNTVTDKLNSTAFSTVSGNFLTAVPEGYATTGDLTSKLDSTAFSDVSGSFLTAVPEGYATTGDLAGKLDTTAQVVTSITTGKLVSTGVSAINSTPILSTGVYKVGSIQIGSGDPGMYLTSQNGTAYYKANELIINRTGYGEQIKFNLGSAGSQIIGSAAGNRGAFIDMSNGSHTAFVGVLSGEDAAIVLDGVSATPNSITSWNGVVSTVSDNSASWAGGSVPEGVLVESGLEYDDTEISGYSGSAFKDVALSETVATNSGAWGGDALPISAGPGIGLSIVDGVLVISVTGGN